MMEEHRATVDEQTKRQAPGAARGWLGWSLLLLAAYFVACGLNFDRTLIATEVWAVHHASRPLAEHLEVVRHDLVHPPLMYLVHRGWIAAFGLKDEAIKVLPILINTPVILLFPWLAKRATRHWRVASFLFLVVFLRPGSVPNLVRMYGLGLLLTVLAMVLWEKWREREGLKTLAAWTCVALLLVYTHLFGALIVAGFFLANWLCGPRRWAFSMAAAIPVLAFLPWLLYVLPVYESRGVEENVGWVTKDWVIAIGDLSYGMLGGSYAIPVERRFRAMVAAAAIHLVLLLLAGLAAVRYGPPQRSAEASARWFWASASVGGVPLVLAFGFSLAVVLSLHWRFLLGILPAYALFLVLACQVTGRLGRAMLYGVLLPWSLIMAAYGHVMSEPHAARGLALRLAEERQAPGLILCDEFCNEFYWEWSIRAARPERIERLLNQAQRGWVTIVPVRVREEIPAAELERIWYVTRRTLARRNPPREFLEQRGFALEREFTLAGVTAEIYAKPGSPRDSP
jgi:hypothetical protein